MSGTIILILTLVIRLKIIKLMYIVLEIPIKYFFDNNSTCSTFVPSSFPCDCCITITSARQKRENFAFF